MNTDRDMKDQVTLTLLDCASDFDVEGIVRHIIAEYGVISIGELDASYYWDVVRQHADTIGGRVLIDGRDAR